jgi:hypothetical protein
MDDPQVIQASVTSNKVPEMPILHSRVPSSGPSQRATFTTSLSIPVIGTRAVTNTSNSNQSSNDTIGGSNGGGHATTGVVSSGPAPARMASSRMATSTHTQTHSSISIEDGFREGGKHPDLGLEPIKVASVLDLNSVRTRGPRVPPASIQGSRPTEPGSRLEERPFGLEDCPAFYPTMDEWHDPIAYIRKITPIAEQSGICKIVPPEGWNMPFVTNTEVRPTHSPRGYVTQLAVFLAVFPFQNTPPDIESSGGFFARQNSILRTDLSFSQAASG